MTTQSVSWDNVVLMKDLEYGNVDGRSLKLNLIRPRTRKGTKLPVVVWIHGGLTDYTDGEWEPEYGH